MSLLADWPCVFLWRPPAGTSDMHSVSLWQRNHCTCLSPNSYINFFSPLSFALTPIYSASALFSQKEMIAITFILTSPCFCSSPDFHSFPAVLSSPAPPPPFSFQPLFFLPQRSKAKQIWLIKSLSNRLLKVPYFWVMGN